MHFPSLLSYRFILALPFLCAGLAHARFITPVEVAKEGAAKAAADKLKSAKDPAELESIFKAFESAAADGSMEAQFALGFFYQNGAGTERSIEKAKASYQKAADKGVQAAKNNLGLLQLAAGDDPKKAVSLVEDVASAGYAPAQISMGQLFTEGVPAAGIAKDPDQARVWFERAADAGDEEALTTLGVMIEQSSKDPEVQARAVSLFQKAVDKGNVQAMIRLGTKLIAGQGVKAEPEKGRELFEQAIKLGADSAKLALATVYETGTGLAKDLKKAYALYLEAADAGNADALNKVAFFHENGLGTDKDEKKAAEWYKKGADKNVGVCIYNLAVFHDEGKGGLEKSAAKAFDLHYKAAMNAFVPSQIALATRYRDGKGVARDIQASLAWFERAAQNNSQEAKTMYAAIIESGAAGFVNYQQAMALYKEAAQAGFPGAMLGLGGMLEEGRGVQADYRMAYQLYLTAQQAGLKDAATERLDKLKKRLSPEQIKNAEAYVVQNGGNLPAAPASSSAEPKPASTPPAGSKPNPPPAKPKPTPVKPKPAAPAVKPKPAVR